MFQFVWDNIDFSHKLDYASSPKDEYNKHMHVFYELILFLRGDVDYNVEGESRHLEPGDIILMTPGQYHFATVNRNISYERYVLKFPAQIVPDSLQERLKGGYPFYGENRQISTVIKTLDSYYGMYSDEDMGLICQAKVTEILVALVNARQKAKEDKQEDIIFRLIDYIQDHIAEDITLEQISKDLHYSESYLSNCFKKTMKCSLMKYIRSKKIILAQTMIADGQKASKVSEELGFNDYSTFYRTYVKITGMNPTTDKKKR